jgi:PKD repeat protein
LESKLSGLPGSVKPGFRHKLLYTIVITLILSLSLLMISCAGPPEAQVVASITSGQAPLSVTFTNESRNSDKFQWDFGDGTTTTTDMNESVIHEYTKAGKHTMTLTAFNKGKPSESNTTTLTITISHGVLDHVKVIPSTVEPEVNGSQQFTAEGMDAYDNPIPEAQLTWEVAERVGSITSNGMFTAGTEVGVYDPAIIVTAILDGHSAKTTVPINVKHGPLDLVEVTPSVVTLGVGESQQFTAEAMDAYGNSIPEAHLVWEIEEGAGSITSNGLFTAGQKAGKGVTAIATLNGNSVKGTASVTLKSGPLHYVKLSPETAGLYYGQSQQFTAEAFDAYDNPIPNVELAWEVIGGVGIITSNGLFTAGTGAGTVQATVVVTVESNGLSASATAVVTISEQLNKFMTYLGMNTKVPYMLNDPKVRRAISLCLDRDEIATWVRETYNNNAQKVLSIVSPTIPDTNISPNQDIEKAREVKQVEF